MICLIIGDYVADNKALYDALMLDKPGNVHFIGRVTNVGDYLLQADAFVLSSLFEGAPISLLEALSAGAVPVCTPVGGLKDIITKDIGFLSEDITAEMFLKALQSLLHAPAATKEQMKTAGSALFENAYSMKTCAARYEALYAEA